MAKRGEVEMTAARPRVILSTHRLEVAQQGKAYADVIEVRLDLLKNRTPACIADELEKFKALSIPLLATLRKVSHGGEEHFQGSEEDRLACFQRAYDYVQAIDVEYDADEIRDNLLKEAGDKGLTRVLSYHNFACTDTESRIQEILAGMMVLDAEVLKLAYAIRGVEDILLLFQTLISHYEKGGGSARPISIIGMGPAGAVTRILFPLFGSCMTYGFLEGSDTPKAPGQLSVQFLHKQLNILRRHKLPLDVTNPSVSQVFKELAASFRDEMKVVR